MFPAVVLTVKEVLQSTTKSVLPTARNYIRRARSAAYVATERFVKQRRRVDAHAPPVYDVIMHTHTHTLPDASQISPSKRKPRISTFMKFQSRVGLESSASGSGIPESQFSTEIPWEWEWTRRNSERKVQHGNAFPQIYTLCCAVVVWSTGQASNCVVSSVKLNVCFIIGVIMT